MAALTLTAFVEFIRDKQLLTPAQAQELPRLQGQFPEVRALARELIGRGWLTPYQANQLLQGNGSDLVLGPYRFLERLGEGGMGQVFKARHVRMNRLVALKVIHKDRLGSPQAVERFTREARAAAQLSHPNIVLAHDADQVGDRHFLAMEYVEGTDLAKLVKESGPLSVGQACEFVRQAALGLQHAHERGVVHRDIKPSNLIVTQAGPGSAPVVKVLDFGLARFESEVAHGTRLTRLGSIMGTVDFIAPEQADNPRKADIRADIYSLGCSLFYLLTGNIPFPGGDAVAKIAARIVDQPPSARPYCPEIPPALDSVLAKMMARQPGERYQTPAEVAAALEPFARLEAPASTAARPRQVKVKGAPAPDATAETILPDPAQKGPGGPGRLLDPTAVETILPDPVQKRRGQNNPQAAPARQTSRTSPRLLPPGLRRHWPWLAGAAGTLLLGVVVIVVILLSRPPSPPADGTTGAQARVASQPSREDNKPGSLPPASAASSRVASQPSREDNKPPDKPPAKPAPVGEIRRFVGHSGAVVDVAFAPNGRTAVSGGHDNTGRLWDVETGKEIHRLDGHADVVTGVGFTPAGLQVVSGSQDKTLRLWDVASGKEVRRFEHAAVVGHGVAVTADGKRIVSWSQDWFVHIWDLESGKELKQFDFRSGLSKSFGLWIAAFSADGRRALTGSTDDVVRLIHVEEGNWHLLDRDVNEATVPVKDRASRGGTLSADGRFAVVFGLDNSLWFYDVERGKPLRRSLQEPAGFHNAAISPDGQRVLTSCGRQDDAVLWDVQTGKEIYRVPGNPGGMSAIRFSPDGRRALSAGRDGTVRLWGLPE